MKNVLRSVLSVALSVSFVGSSFAQVQPSAEHAPKPDYDRRSPAKPGLPTTAQNAALARVKALVPSTVVDFDEALGTPKFIRSQDGFLTGFGGEGRTVSSQAAQAIPQNDPDRAVKTFLTDHSALFGHGPEVLASAGVLRQSVGEHNGLRTMVWNQKVDGIPVFEGVLIGNTTRNGELVSLSSQFLPNPSQNADAGTPNRASLESNPPISAVGAIVAAASDLGETWSAAGIVATGAPVGDTGFQKYQTPRQAYARQVWLPLDQNKSRLCWEIILDAHQDLSRYQTLVDVETGKTWLRRSLNRYLTDATYNVFTSDSPSPFSPGWPTPNTAQPALTNRVLVTLPALDTNASPDGWIPDSGNTTTGNNVDAFVDRNFDGQPDQARPAGASRVFDFAQDLTQDPKSYIDASTVQMFYWVNWYHDRVYELGFNEAAGNYQLNNFGRGGIGNDYIIAYVQAGSDVGLANNAFFAPAPDGINGQIAMFTWSFPNPNRDGDLDADVILHEATHGTSERLVGGGVLISALQPSGMGEGWSDFYALSLLSQPTDDPDAVYASGGYASYRLAGLTENYYFGIRHYPYCTDMAKNPFTFKDIDPTQILPHTGVPLSPIYPFNTAEASEVHHQGEIWCVTLWDVRANLIHKYGPTASQMMLQFVTDGMKLSPANPTFLQARDAIILADRVDNSGADVEEMWKGFAKRGMGASAVAPASSTTTGVIESYDVPGLLIDSVLLSGGNGNGIIDPNECNTLRVGLFNASGAAETGISARLSTTTPGILIAQPVALYNDTPAGATNFNLTDFHISSSPAFVCGTPVNLMLVVKSDQETRTNSFTLSTTLFGLPIRFDNNSLVAIPDSDPAGASSAIVVSNFNNAVGQVTVALHINHTYDSDLLLQLIAPDGTTTVLSANNGGSGDNYGVSCSPDSQRTIFDDASTNSISSGNPPFVGIFTPDQPLSVYSGKNGTNVNGVWQLHVIDQVGGDVGTIQCWSLFLSPALCTDGGGECPGVDLAIAMVATPDPVFQGSNLLYSISVTNFGPNTAKGVVLSQVLPSGATYVSATTSQGTVSQSGGVVTFNLGIMPVNGVVNATVLVQAGSAGLATSTANVSSSDTDNDPSNNSVTVSTHVNPPFADLAVGIFDSPDPVLVAQALTYTISVTNKGPAPATGVIVTNVLPPSMGIGSSIPSQGSILSSSGNLVIASLGSISNGGTATVVIHVTPNLEGTFSASATVVGTLTDPFLGNNTASATTVVGPSADLGIGVISAPGNVVVGSNFNYIVTVSNRGPSTATGVTVQDSLPPGLAVISSIFPVTNNALTANLGTLNPGAVTSITFQVNFTNLISSLPTNLVNSPIVSGDQGDPNTANNIATVTTLIDARKVQFAAASALLTMESIAPTNGTVDIGETVTVQLYLQNIGNVPNTNLFATLLATNGVTSPSGSQNYGIIAPSGVANRPFTFTASGTNGGTISATLQLMDVNLATHMTNTALSNVVFTFALPSLASFSNTNRIDLPSALQDQQQPGPAGPYPSSIAVSSLTGLIGKVAVTLSNLNHTFPHDINLLLVAPNGKKVVLMSDAADGSAVSGANVTFDDAAASPLPASGDITTGSWQPSAYNANPAFTNPAPAGPYATTLNTFSGPAANGVWSLYANDDSAGDFGAIAGGWSLTFTSVTPVNQIADLAVTTASVPSPVLVGIPVTNTFNVSNLGPNAAASVLFSTVLPSGTTFLSAVNSGQASLSFASGVVSGSLGSMNVGSNVTISVAFVPNNAGALSNFSSVSVSSGEIDLNLGNNSAVAQSSAIYPAADLAISGVAAPMPVTVGSNLTFTLSITNNGPQNALNVVVSNTLPVGVSLLSSNSYPPGATFSLSGGVLVANLGNLANAGTASVSFVVAPLTAASFTNVASVSTRSTDAQGSNNFATNTVVALAPAATILPAGAVLTAESLSPPDGSLEAGETVTISMALTNAGTIDTTPSFTATLLASGGVSSPSSPAVYGVIAHGGAVVSRSFSFTALSTPSGVVTATLQLQDGTNNLGNVTYSFALPITTGYTNVSGIVIPNHGVASPYPAAINISGLTGVVGHVSVSLKGFAHTFPDDVDVMLVSPSGQKVVLMSDVGGGHPVSNIDLSFDDSATQSLPDSNEILSGTYKPTDFEPGDIFPSPAPAGTPSPNLAAFNGSDPNGVWSLYVVDDSVGDSGIISGGWSLTITTVSPLSPVLDLVLAVSASPNPVFVGSALTYSITLTNRGPAAATGVVVSDLLPANCTLVSSSASLGAFVTNGSTISLSVANLPAGSGLAVSVRVSPSSIGTALNTVSVTSPQTDVDLSSNFAQTSTTIISPAAPRLRILPLANSLFDLTVTAEPGQVYNIQGSSNLTSWSTVLTGTASQAGVVKYTATNAPAGNRYFRAVRVP